MPDGLDSMMAKVGSRAQRPPKVPVTPSLHPRTLGGQSPAAPPSEEKSEAAQEPMTPSAQGASTPRGHGDQGKAAHVPTKAGGAYAPRRGKIQLRADQESWLNDLVADAMREGVRVSEGDVLRLALDRLRAGGAGWHELRDAVVAETRARTRRRAGYGINRREEEEAG